MTKAAELAKMGEVLTNSQIGGRRNMVINGAMQVAQRGTSATDLGASDGYFTVDRFQLNFSSTSARLTMTQDSPTDLSGFTKALKLDCTTADTSIGADEFIILHYKLEGQDVQQLKKGTSDAEKITVSFYVKANANATYTLEIEDVDNNRYNSQEFSVTTSWNRVSLTFDGDTTGVLGNDNGNSIRLNFWLHVGSDFAGGTHTSNVWHTTNNQRVGDNQTSFADSTDRTFFLTGLQMEVGSQATPFEHRSFGEELALCQRYFQKSYADNVAPSTVTNNGAFWTNIIRNASNQNYWHVQTYQTMRSQPSVTTHSPATGTSGKFENDTDGADRDSAVSNTSNTGFSIRPNSGTSNDLGDVVAVHWVADSEL
tara:strand:+ start:638 stop:1744 length:1107 start_codon:yes stop_codon:yes gene_type:complete